MYYIKKDNENQMKFLLIFQISPSLDNLNNIAYYPICGKPLALLQFERLQQVKLVGDIAITVSSKIPEKKIQDIFADTDVDIVKNIDMNNLERNTTTAIKHEAEHIVLVTNECPLIDPEIIDQAIEYYIDNLSKYDYVSNMHPESYPAGNCVEVINTFALGIATKWAKYEYEKQFSTPFVWDNPENWRIGNIKADMDHSKRYRYFLDFPEDLEVVTKIYERFYPKSISFSYSDIISFLNDHPKINSLNDKHKGINWYSKYFRQLKTITINDTRLNP
jgi:spore coat polysaccharide biosynthesis protein SpsF